MRTDALRRYARVPYGQPRTVVAPPPRILEYGYYFSVFYSIMGATLGLSVGFIGAGFLAALAVTCLLFHGAQAVTVYRPIFAALLCGTLFVALQVLVHDEPLLGEYIRPFVTWLLALLVAQSLCLRPGFFQRFAFVVFGIGLMLLPYLRSNMGDPSRAGLDQSVGGLSNPNDLGAWFGFCCVYFIVAGIEAKLLIIRAGMWVAAVGCLYMLGLTVSRGPLFGVAIAAIVATRHLLRRGFVPALVLVMLAFIIYNLGLFDQITTRYETRGTEETGRFLVWPVVIDRFLDAPLVGVGVSRVATYIPTKGREITPHNGFLFIALASGLLPALCFVAYWWQAIRGVLTAPSTVSTETPSLPVFVVYAFIIALMLNTPFTFSWTIVTLALATTAGAQARTLPQLPLRNRGRRRYVPFTPLTRGYSPGGGGKQRFARPLAE